MDAEIGAVKRKISEVEQRIKDVEGQINNAEGELTRAARDADVVYWRNKEERLRNKEEQLRIEKERLWNREEQLRKEKLTSVEETSAKRQRISGRVQLREKCFFKTDFEAKDCDIIDKREAGTLVSTDGMHEVMKRFGGFPAAYYVRLEEINVFKTILSQWEKRSSEGKLGKSAILGSPGVGKSVFIVFLAFYMARLKSRSVLLLRSVKGELSLKCVYLSRDYYCEVEVPELRGFGEFQFLLRKEFPDVLYFVDGFLQQQVILDHALSAYQLLATSSQFRRKGDDPTELVIVPAWQFSDLEDFAKQTEMFKNGGDAKDVYEYSGGSLREFCRDLSDLKRRVVESLSVVPGTGEAVVLMGRYGGAAGTQVDGLRRRYLNDPKDMEQYQRADNYFVVDSSYVLRELLRRCDVKQYEELYFFTKVYGGALYGWAFEFYLHKLATSGGFTIQARKYRSDDQYEQYEIKCSEPTLEGTSESECKSSLLSWASNEKSKYWYPAYSQFPNIDSVVKTVRKSTGQEVLAYIQITVGEKQDLDGKWMDKLDEELEAHHATRMYIAIQPRKEGSQQILSLKSSPTSLRVPLYGAYFEAKL